MLHVTFQQFFLLHTQRQNHRRGKLLGSKLLILQIFHRPLIQHLFMGGVLINDIKLFMEFYQPISTEYLSNQAVLTCAFL